MENTTPLTRGKPTSPSFDHDALQNRADLFKALGNPVRLLILNLALEKPRHGDELAVILNLSAPTVSHHLTQLAEAGLLSAKREQYYTVFSAVPEALTPSLEALVRLPSVQPLAPGEDPYRARVLRTFLKNGRVTAFPAQEKKFLVLLEHMLAAFEPGRRYTEKEVNFILLDFNEDVAAIRRGFIEYGYMERENGIYWRKG